MKLGLRNFDNALLKSEIKNKKILNGGFNIANKLLNK